MVDCITEEENISRIRIERPFYEHRKLREDFQYEKPRKPSVIKKWIQDFNMKKAIVGAIPVLEWIPEYNWKKDIIKDLIAGITVGIMQIPQGMAYALLGNVPAITGLYMAFFPVIMYFFFGTSKHTSIGTFSITCLMTGKAVLKYSDPAYFSSSHISLGNNSTDIVPTGYSPVQVATAVTFIVAVIQLGMYIIQLGAASALFSETLQSGFMSGAALQVILSQVKDIFGLELPKFQGNFSTIYTFIAIFERIGDTNVATLIISCVTILVLVIYTDYLKRLVSKISPVPFPMELIVVLIGTLVSKYCYLEDKYAVKVFGHIPIGLPEPTPPIFNLLPYLITDGISIAIVSYTLHLSATLMLSQNMNYEVEPNQELLAMGLSNLFGSFFSCMPICASFSRSLVQQAVGGVSLFASIISCVLVLIVLLWVGPFFEPLPRAILAGIIMVAIKGMFKSLLDFWKFWKLSKIDALVWMGTFLTVLFLGVDIGLLCGMGLSLLSVFFLSLKPHTCLLGRVPNTDFYLDIARYKSAKEIDGVKIVHYSGGINFATRSFFKSDLIRLIGLNPQKEVVYRARLSKYSERIHENGSSNMTQKMEKMQNKVNKDLKCIIIDFSSISHIDPSGVSMLKSISESFNKLDISVCIASCRERIYEMLTKVHPEYTANGGFISFSTIHDAVHYVTESTRSSTINCTTSIT